MMEAIVKNYMDAKEIAGILAMNGYSVSVEPVEPVEPCLTAGRALWRIKFSRE